MAIHKENTADLRKQYSVYLEIGTIFTLLLLILAFRVDIRNGDDFQTVVDPREVVHIEDIPQTEHETTPPPPLRPLAPVEVPNDEIIESEPVDFDPPEGLIQMPETAPAPPPSNEKDEPDYFVVVEEHPQLIGGMAALLELVDYPKFAKKAGIEGTVFVQFIVDEQGNVQNPQVTRGVHKLLDQAALEAVKKMEFRPGKQRGQVVKVQMSLPVRFQLR